MNQRFRLIIFVALLSFMISIAQTAQIQRLVDIEQHHQQRNVVPQAPQPTTLHLLPRFANTTTSTTSTISTTHIQNGPDVTLTRTNPPTNPTPTPTSLPTSEEAAQDGPSETDGDGLSAQTKIGVGVGVGVGLTALLLGGFAWLYFHRKRVLERRRRSGGGSGSQRGSGAAGKEGWRGWHTAF